MDGSCCSNTVVLVEVEAYSGGTCFGFADSTPKNIVTWCTDNLDTAVVNCNTATAVGTYCWYTSSGARMAWSAADVNRWHFNPAAAR
ncbi:MAG: hypothetical protein WCW27_06695 [Patescibacteria group bacterium]